jgi:hypothetical protein
MLVLLFNNLGPFFKFMLVEEVCVRLLVNPLVKIIDLICRTFTHSGKFVMIASGPTNIIEELGEASRVVEGEVFDYV